MMNGGRLPKCVHMFTCVCVCVRVCVHVHVCVHGGHRKDHFHSEFMYTPL